MIVADASSIISFARANKLDLLKQVVKYLIIPEGVYEEIVIKGSGKPGATEVNSALWIEVRKIIDRSKMAGLPDKLGQGEKKPLFWRKSWRVFSWLMILRPERKLRGGNSSL